MDQYSSELLKTFIYTIKFIFVTFIILYLIYYLKKRNYNSFGIFLEKNKIYIEIFLVISLSFMSIIVATNANIIAENELKIQKANNQPKFDFDEKLYGYAHYEKLLVYNNGAPLNNFFISPIFLIVIQDHKDNKYKEIKIPITDYYNVTTSGTDSRILQEFSGADFEPLNGNYYKLTEMINRFYEISRKDNLSGDITFDRYVNINYEDIYGEKHNDLYIISFYPPHKVSDVEKEKILFDIQESKKNGHFLDIKNLSAEKAYNIFKTSY